MVALLISKGYTGDQFDPSPFNAVVALLISKGYTLGGAANLMEVAVVALLISKGYTDTAGSSARSTAVVALLISKGYTTIIDRAGGRGSRGCPPDFQGLHLIQRGDLAHLGPWLPS